MPFFSLGKFLCKKLLSHKCFCFTEEMYQEKQKLRKQQKNIAEKLDELVKSVSDLPYVEKNFTVGLNITYFPRDKGDIKGHTCFTSLNGDGIDFSKIVKDHLVAKNRELLYKIKCFEDKYQESKKYGKSD